MRSKKKETYPSILPVQEVKTVPFDGTEISLDIRVENSSFSRSSTHRLKVKISNTGESNLEDLFLEAFTPAGIDLADPGALFGNTRRHVRIPELKTKKSITYKLELRSKPDFTSGELKIFIRSAMREKSNVGAHFALTLVSQP